MIANLTQAQNTVSSDNSTVATAQLTAVIGELSDILGKITTDNNGPYLEEHAHFFTHKGHTHTVTQTHPHHADQHTHHPSWTKNIISLILVIANQAECVKYPTILLDLNFFSVVRYLSFNGFR